jgi:hypothetical protein
MSAGDEHTCWRSRWTVLLRLRPASDAVVQRPCVVRVDLKVSSIHSGRKDTPPSLVRLLDIRVLAGTLVLLSDRDALSDGHFSRSEMGKLQSL